MALGCSEAILTPISVSASPCTLAFHVSRHNPYDDNRGSAQQEVTVRLDDMVF